MVDCTSLPQTCLLGPLVPRVPGRTDPQVPNDGYIGIVKYGRIPYVYFYVDGHVDDAAYGFLDIEIALHPTSSDGLAFELYCIGDGYQSGAGSDNDHPLVIEVRAGARVLAEVKWSYPSVIDGHADPMHFFATLPLPEADFTLIDNIFIPPVRGIVR